MTIGEKIQYMRKKAGMSQEELAEAVGVSRQAVSKWETEEATPEVSKLLALSRAFGVTADWLISDGGPDEPPSPDRNREEPKVEPREPPPDWARSMPGLRGRVFRRFGALSAARTVMLGVVFTVIGALMRFVHGTIFRSAMWIETAGDEPATITGTPVFSTWAGISNTASAAVLALGLALLVFGAAVLLVIKRYEKKYGERK